MKKFKIYERLPHGIAEVVFAYPRFTSLEEAFKYIRIVLDPYFTGHYGVVVETP